jgi:hypothetical protein
VALCVCFGCGLGPWVSLGSMLVRSMDGCVWRMCYFSARTTLSLADMEGLKELDRMIVAFLRTPLESASASQ